MKTTLCFDLPNEERSFVSSLYGQKYRDAIEAAKKEISKLARAEGLTDAEKEIALRAEWIINTELAKFGLAVF
jgi:hypothetical protein